MIVALSQFDMATATDPIDKLTYVAHKAQTVFGKSNRRRHQPV
jgi:hypothetical protein